MATKRSKKTYFILNKTIEKMEPHEECEQESEAEESTEAEDAVEVLDAWLGELDFLTMKKILKADQQPSYQNKY
ncbi:hypothetical protein M8J76_011164 [Diaphorina citri]|nr:hypothetical protein M8J75_010974 [Diaphorina citri]KAI5726923.1 hypothetical protein M8J76_011164 [Diaphorina citri]KAI5731438.1 hypothetical protein M8J77_010002 [Diaphorina citri]